MLLAFSILLLLFKEEKRLRSRICFCAVVGTGFGFDKIVVKWFPALETTNKSMKNGETIASSTSSLSEKPFQEKKLMESGATADTGVGDDHRESYPTPDVDDEYLRRPLKSTNGDDGDDDGSGPTCNDSGANEVGRSSFPAASPTPRKTSSRSSNIFRDDTISSNTLGGGTPTPTLTTLTTLQPFDISLTQTAFKSPGIFLFFIIFFLKYIYMYVCIYLQPPSFHFPVVCTM